MLDKLELPMVQLAEVSTADLATIQAHLDREEATLKRRKDTFAALMLRKFEAAARAAYAEAQKDTGTVNLAAPGSNMLSLKVEIDKKVEWDQTKLPAIFNKMTPENSRHYAKVAYSVPEAIYKAAPPDVQKTLATARTLKPGKMKFTFVPVAEAEAEAA